LNPGWLPEHQDGISLQDATTYEQLVVPQQQNVTNWDT